MYQFLIKHPLLSRFAPSVLEGNFVHFPVIETNFFSFTKSKGLNLILLKSIIFQKTINQK